MQPGLNANRASQKTFSIIGWSSLRLVVGSANQSKAGSKRVKYLNRRVLQSVAVMVMVVSCVALFNSVQAHKSSGITLTTNTNNTSDAPVVLPPSVMAKSQPTHLSIESINISTDLINTGQKSDNSIDMPVRYDVAAWYDHSPTPGERGPSIIVGHVDNYKGPGVFIRLKQIKYGDIISVTRADGSVAKFSVTDMKEYSKHDFPSQEVYGGINYAGIRLITCGGPFNSQTGDYPDNVVVFGKLVQ